MLVAGEQETPPASLLPREQPLKPLQQLEQQQPSPASPPREKTPLPPTWASGPASSAPAWEPPTLQKTASTRIYRPSIAPPENEPARELVWTGLSPLSREREPASLEQHSPASENPSHSISSRAFAASFQEPIPRHARTLELDSASICIADLNEPAYHPIHYEDLFVKIQQ